MSNKYEFKKSSHLSVKDVLGKNNFLHIFLLMQWR